MKSLLIYAPLLAVAFGTTFASAASSDTVLSGKDASRITTEAKSLKGDKLLQLVAQEVKSCPTCAPDVVVAVIDSVGISSPIVPSVVKTAIQAHPNPDVAYDSIVRAVGEKAIGSDFMNALAKEVGVNKTTDPRSFLDNKAAAAANGSQFLVTPPVNVVPPDAPVTPPAPDVSRS